MIQTPLIAVIVACCFAYTCNADEPVMDWDKLLKQICGGQWMINEDRHRMVETREKADGSISSRSYIVDNCFKPIIRTDTYRYDKSTKKLTAKIVWSNGSAWECDGVWNPESKTLTWTANLQSGIRSFSFQIISPQITKYAIQDTDTQGNPGWEYSEKRYLLSE